MSTTLTTEAYDADVNALKEKVIAAVQEFQTATGLFVTGLQVDTIQHYSHRSKLPDESVVMGVKISVSERAQ